MRANIVAGNWKMNNDMAATQKLIGKLLEAISPTDTQVKIAPTFVNLAGAKELVAGTPIEVVAQNMHFADNGAYTGEISASMLQNIGVNSVILGHSERRSLFDETDEMLAKKVATAIEKEMEVIFCFGEMLEERKSGEHFNVVKDQLSKALFGLQADSWQQIILAYEPVWAIGTGETASPDQAQEMHSFIRKTLADQYSESLSEEVSILYGGSVKPGNAREIFAKPDVDGGLIGGASLVAEDFAAIVSACG